MLEFTLTHNGTNWIARNGSLTIEAPSLERLDVEIGRALRAKGPLKGSAAQDVFMAFDNSTIPQWIRQYMPHYFNRIVHVTEE